MNEILTDLFQYVAVALSHMFTISAQTGIYSEILKCKKLSQLLSLV